ncbi:MAG: UDP-N-acetylglucosamine 2-epimerase [Anaerolineae bacterium]
MSSVERSAQRAGEQETIIEALEQRCLVVLDDLRARAAAAVLGAALCRSDTLLVEGLLKREIALAEFQAIALRLADITGMRVDDLAEMARYPDTFEQMLIRTGQHYDPVLRPGRMCDNMSKVFFEDLELPQPDIYLGVGSGSHAQQTARIMLAFEPVLLEHRPDWVIVASS